jgi:high-affinity iron transporter
MAAAIIAGYSGALRSGALVLLLVATAGAQPVERIAGIVGYVAVDYFEAVRDGMVTSRDEYEEQRTLLGEALSLARALPAEALVRDLTEMARAIEERAPLERIRALSVAVRSRLIAEHGLEVAPRVTPSVARGRTLYRVACAACHGAGGRGDGAPAAWLEPPPTSLADGPRMMLLSPQHVYRVLTVGLGSAGMPDFAALPAADRWSLAFFAVAMRHGRADVRAGERRFRAAGPRLAPTATRLAAAADAELFALLAAAIPDEKERAAALAWLRLEAAFSSTPAGRYGAVRRELTAGRTRAARAILPALRGEAPDLAARFEAALGELDARAAGAALRAQMILDAAEERPPSK